MRRTQGLHDLVAEVDLAQASHERLVLGIGPRQLHLLVGLQPLRIVGGGGPQRLGVGEVLVRSHVLVFEAAEQRDHRLDVSSGITEGPEVLEGELEEVIAHEDHLLGSCEHTEVRGEPELEAFSLISRSPKA